MPDQEPITKDFLLGALQQMETRLEVRIDQRFERIDQRFEKIDQRFNEFDKKLEELSENFDIKLERVETKLLSAFHGWARPMDTRTRRNSENIHEFDQRLILIEERVAKLEQQPTQFRQ